ncbi:RluA family pseudouridine synthase [Phenylobacterium sp. SCN 70-31]|uniref:RluA family pseudouridine synthase n=1 Tax=Phenylobacterium sp. SCN 70-31 TaxID=1660129 RepID=UPI00086EEB40|nr:RluA family pseudouridine synthase [Phenylobacterium sp. SCN 70-31]ODT85407.1 MAG: RNA pseudouridine synthase [Phenylobacterium sp. SCN 70-31]
MKPHPKPVVPKPVALSPEEIAFVRGLVLYEDSEILALNKPPGLSSQGGRGQVHTLDELLWAFARPGKARPRLIHRLDRDTSGVILTAKTKPAAGFLGKALMARKVAKHYLAIVTPGAPEPRSGVIDQPLRRDEQGREAFMRPCDAGHPDAETAVSRYRARAAGEGAALLELSPETGRMHQLRVHLASIGRPIAGDARYGGALVVDGHPVPRLMLHAAALEFPHPAGGRRRLEAPPPADMTALATALGLA